MTDSRHKAREALAPFADACDSLFEDWHSDGQPAFFTSRNGFDEAAPITVEDFRRAREALQALEREIEGEAGKAEEIARLNRLATDRLYFMEAYHNMLGPKGLAVAAMWRESGVKRVHYSWGPDAASLTGEERAQAILDIGAASRIAVKFVGDVAVPIDPALSTAMNDRVSDEQADAICDLVRAWYRNQPYPTPILSNETVRAILAAAERVLSPELQSLRRVPEEAVAWDGTENSIVESFERAFKGWAADPTMPMALRDDLSRFVTWFGPIRGLFVTAAHGDKEDLITYAKEVVALRRSPTAPGAGTGALRSPRPTPAQVRSYVYQLLRDSADMLATWEADHDYVPPSPAQPETGDGVRVTPLKWRVPSDRPNDPDVTEAVFCADGFGGVYAISRKQKVGPERLLWWAHDPMDWTGFNSIDEAKAAAQADYEQRIRSALTDGGSA